MSVPDRHMLEDCPAWETERRVLVRQIERNLLPPVGIDRGSAGEQRGGR